MKTLGTRSMSHTPEPWKLVPRIRPDAGMTTQIVALPKAETIVLANEENAARIIAAVNGCTGLNPAAFRACVEALRKIVKSANARSKTPVHYDLIADGEEALAQAEATQP